MTAQTIPGLDEAIEQVYTTKPTNFPSPEVAIEDSIGMWWHDVQGAVFERWDCDSDTCPGRPAWDDQLGEQSHEAMDKARDEAIALFRDRLVEFAERFMAEHPEAVLRTVEPAS